MELNGNETDNRDVPLLCSYVKRNLEGRHPMNVQDACDHFSISKGVYYRYIFQSFPRYLRHYNFKFRLYSFLGGKDVGHRGRKRLLEKQDLETVQGTITGRARNLDAMDSNDVRELMQTEILQKKEMNHLADKETFAPISRRTVQRYINNDLTSSEIKEKNEHEV